MDDSSITALSGVLAGGVGKIEVTANTVSISNQSTIRTGSVVFPSGPAENIILNADTLSVSNSTLGNVETFPGAAFVPGAITIQGLAGTGSSATLVTLTNSQLNANGGPNGFPGGPITIQAKDVALNQSHLSSFGEDTRGGPITIIAESQIHMVGSGLSSNSGEGNGGTIVLQAGDRINLSNTDISASSFGLSGLGGGIVSLSAPVISMHGGAIAADHETGGRVGTINIDATKGVYLTDGARISADGIPSFQGGGGGGNISIHAGGKVVVENSTISAQSAQGNGGTIHVQADHKIKLTDSTLTTSVAGGPGTVGGAITLDSNVVRIQNGQILSPATEGHGGTINITASKRVVEDAASVISAVSDTGPDGSVTITAPRTILHGVVEP
jgi:hypothetical protein